jgi:isopentenyl-diphosphate delta-isomerase
MPNRTLPRALSSRKKQHVDITLSRNVLFRKKTTGLERFDFVHNALPEIDLADVDTSADFLGHRVSLPLMVSCMTGGYREALTINRHLAEVCAELGIAMGVGSQRQALVDTHYHRTFSIVREVAPSIALVGNIGAAEVRAMKDVDDARRLIELIRADALAVHLNPLQEMLQGEGTPTFRGVLSGIALLVAGLPVPVIVKEIGAGISQSVARQLLGVGVRHIDVAGAGGTSWAGVETLRTRGRRSNEAFWDWGIPTAEAIRDVAALRTEVTGLTVIASGGIRSGLEAAKSIALGADLVASARPMLLALNTGGTAGVLKLVRSWAEELKRAMFLTGSCSIAELQRAQLREADHP